MNKEKMSKDNSVIAELKKSGFRAALIPFSCIEQIREIYESHVDNSEKTPVNIKERFLSNQPPNITFEPASFLVVAFQSPKGEIHFSYKDKEISIPIPPIYLDDSIDHRIKETLSIATNGCQFSMVDGVSLKLLAVLSGLGKYGRNTLCYMDDFGSFCNFAAYYTDIPCEDNIHEIAIMDICKSCGLCRKNCPTGALSGELKIDTSRCLTMWNEFDSPIPDWILPDVHHSMIGCMRCQEVCPVNKSVSMNKKEVLELSEVEIELLLTSAPKNLPVELVNRFIDYGLWMNFINLAGRNLKLAVDAIINQV